ncbi:MAG: TldD/PmbA family protein [Candidatus Woesearchaeota archaeon]
MKLANYVLGQLMKKGADDVVVSSENKVSQLIKFSENKINATKNWELNNLNVFLAINKKLVTTNIRDISQASTDEIIKKLLAYAESAPVNHEYQGIAHGPFSYKEIPKTYDPKILSMGEQSIDYVEQAIDQAKTIGAKRSAGVFETVHSQTELLTSHNVKATEKSTQLYFSIRCFADKFASGHMVCVSRTLKDFEIEDTVSRAAKTAIESKNPQRIEAGTYDVVFDHMPFANLLGQVGQASSAFSVEAGLSCLANKIGEKVGSEIITLSDCPCLPNGFNSTMFDDEGTPTKNKQIIQNGKLKTYLHNTSTGKRHNTTTTGNAGILSPEPFNLVLEAGKVSKQEMIESVKLGVYLTNVWYTRFQNYNTGDFSTIPRDGAFLIKNGKLVHPVKELRVSDNLLNILKSTAILTKETKQVFGWEVNIPVVTPIALVNGVRVTRSEK